MSENIVVFGTFAFFLAAAAGWIMNVAKFFMALYDPLTAMEAVRLLAIFVVPVGCIVGWL